MPSLLDMLRGLTASTPAEPSVAPAPPSPLADDAFLAFISHELRTPLNAIIGYSEILQEDAVFHDQKDFLPDLKKIQKASEHLLALVDDIVDLSRIEAGKVDLAAEEFKVSAMVKEVVKDARNIIDKTFSTFECEVPEGDDTMKGDRIKVQRALSNLIRHTMGLAHQGKVRLDVDVEDGKARHVRFRLSHDALRAKDLRGLLDTNPGKSALPQYHGSGLGLVITDRFCRLMGGSFEVDAMAGGEGALITMRIPTEPR